MAEEPTNPLPKSAEQLISDFLQVPHDGSRSRRRPTQGLAPLVEGILDKYRIGREAPEHTLRENWAQVVGHANAHYSHVAEIDARGRAVVLASHSVVRNELFHHRASIVEKIRKLPGCGHIREIHVRAG
jgi:Dna[CI] antecedent, DciA